jgi:hypothetical protein
LSLIIFFGIAIGQKASGQQSKFWPKLPPNSNLETKILPSDPQIVKQQKTCLNVILKLFLKIGKKSRTTPPVISSKNF